MRFKTGVCSVSFRDRSPEEIVSEIKKTPLTHIEWGSDVHLPVGERLCFPVAVSSYGTYFRLGTTPIHALPEYIATAKSVGTNVLRLWCGNCNSDECEDKKALFDECRKASEIAEREGVILCMECHEGTFTDTPEAAIELMTAVGSDNFRMYWQPNQYRTFEENLRSAKLLSTYVENIHVFNWEGDKRLSLSGVQDVWKRYLECFSKGVLLLEFMPDGKLESLQCEAETLVKIAEDFI